MNFFANMHPVSVVVIVMILMLFILSVVLLMTVSTSYRKQKKLATVGDTHRSALVRDVLQEFTAAYNTFGQETNTPAIITSCSTLVLVPQPVMRVRAASTPSADVPLINPTTRREGWFHRVING